MTQRRMLIWYWGRRGGGPLMTELLISHLLQKGFADQLAVSLSTQNERREPCVHSGVVNHFVDTFADTPTMAGLLRLIPRLRRDFKALIDKVQPEIIVIPMMFGAVAPLIDIAKRGSRQVVYTVHDARQHSGDRHAVGQTLTQKLMFGLSDQIVAVSNAVGDELCARKPSLSQKIRVEKLTGLYQPQAMPRSRPTADLRFLMPGRLVWYKGYERLAEAMKLMDRQDFSVTVCGDGPYRSTVETLFSGDARVRMDLTWHSPDDHAALYRDHDVVLCPYNEASQSGILCEALIHAVPSIVTPVGALPEQMGFGKAGIVLKSMEPGELAGAMTAMIDNRFDYATSSHNTLHCLNADAQMLNWSELLTA